jgi:hypothetical protein
MASGAPPQDPPLEARPGPRPRRRARRRHNPWVDRLLWTGGAICALLFVLGLVGQQRMVARLAGEVAQLRQQQAVPAAPATASAMASAMAGQAWRPGAVALATPASIAPQPTATLAHSALQTLQTPCPDVAAALAQYQRQFLAPMHYWGVHALRDLPSQRVTYLFAGPDAATAVSVFPRAQHLVLVANQTLEPAGAPSPAASVLAAECQIWRFFARMGYFRTHDLDGRGGQRPRVAALLMQGLELADVRVTAAEYLSLDASGEIAPALLPVGHRPFGIRFHAIRPDGSRVAVDYVTIDLSDTALRRNEAQAAALKQLLTSTVLMKAASHLPQEPAFGQVARWTAERAPAVVQDETGLAVQSLRAHFKLRYYGQFTQAHTLWRGKASTQALMADVAASEVEPLLFTFGYEKPAGSLVMVGRRLDAGTVPATPALAVHQR